ncbi:MAG: adenylosuccinate synthase, partial [Proteobacteria bacterium]|nr:adenylosuccinate synthase [Pseudomonadota bacterium]
MPQAVVIIGVQWGDEGKGKIVDYYSSAADVVARFQGGNNAGHTLVVEGKQTILHLIPSGILHPHTRCAIGSGVVVDPENLLKEVEVLRKAGVPDLENRIWLS